jgi:hypothetical protein
MIRILAFVAAIALTGLTGCNSARPNPAAPRDMKAELDQFRDFVREHPHVLDELQKDPSLIRTPTFAEEHRRLANT